MLAAIRLGVPTAIHEQNAVLGRANRLLASRVSHIATGFAATAGLRPADRARAVHTGNPVRPAVLAVAGAEYRPPQPGAPVEILITGGSQGARIFADIVPEALAALPPALRGALARQPAGAARGLRPGGRAIERGRHRRRDQQLFHRHPGAAGARAARDLPLGGLDDRGAGCGRTAGAAGALSARDRRPPDRERPRFRRFRRGLGHSAAGFFRGDADPDARRASRRCRGAAPCRGAGAALRSGRRGRPAGARWCWAVGRAGPGSPARSAPHEIAAGLDRADPFCRHRRHRDERHRRGTAQSRLSRAGQRSGRRRQYAPARRRSASRSGSAMPRKTSKRPRSS